MSEKVPKIENFSKETEKFILEEESENQLFKDVLERRRVQEEERKKNSKEKDTTPTEQKKSDKEKAEDLSNEIKETGAFKEFNVSFEELEKISGFEKLSNGQRLLVAENLKQLTLGRVHEEAGEKYEKDTAKARFLGRVWKGISKKYQIAKLEKSAAKNIISGGMEIHKDALVHLIERASDGPDVEVLKEGKLEVLYASGMENLNPEQKESIESFNQIASKFSKMPEEWRAGTASKKEQEKYKALRDQYEKTKADILEIKRDKSGYKEAALYVNDIDSRVYGDQFLNTHPDVEKQLQNITDKSIWTRAMANVATERGLYLAGGFITRTLTTSLLGLAGAPLAAAGMGGFIARKRAKEALVEHEKGARRGVEDRSKEAKNFVSVDSMREKLEKLSEKISTEKDPEKREKLLISLRARISYTQGKMEDGLINYGKGTERFASQYELISSLSSATVHAGAGRTGKSELGLRLDDFLQFKKQKISEAQEKYVRDQMIRGAVMGAGFAVAGYALRHFGEEWFGWGETEQSVTKTENSKVDFTAEQNQTVIKTEKGINIPNSQSEVLPVNSLTGIEENIRNLASEIQETPEYVVQQGDNIWKIIENKLEAHDIFRGLEEGQRTYLINELKDKVSAMSPQELKEFGIGSGDPNVIYAGETLDFSKIMNTESISGSVAHIETLTDAQIVSIEENNIKIADWVKEHPDTTLTAEKIDIILGSEGYVGVEEIQSLKPLGTTSRIDPEELFIQKIDTLYGSEGILNTSGENSFDWRGLKGKTVEEVMNKNTFPSEDIWGDEIEQTGIDSEEAVRKTQEYVQNLINEGGIKPVSGETIEEFYKRTASIELEKVSQDKITSIPTIPKTPEEILKDLSEPEHLLSDSEMVEWIMQNKLKSIYEDNFLFFKGSKIEEWIGDPEKGIVGVKDMKVENILKGDFGEGVNSAASDNKKRLLDFLYGLRKGVEPTEGETTENYMRRALATPVPPPSK